MEELPSKLQLLYEDSWKVHVSAGSSSQDVEDSLNVCELDFQIARRETEGVAVVAVAEESKRKLNALQVLCAELDSRVTRFHSEDDVV